jgi:hypothetical protein
MNLDKKMNPPCCDECWTKGLERVRWWGDDWEDEAIRQACRDGISDREWWVEFFAGKEDTTNAKSFFCKILYGCSSMEHKSCVMAMLEAVAEQPFSSWPDHVGLPFILGDLEMTHALQTKTNFVNHVFSTLSVSKMPVDVYRYIIAQSDNKAHRTNYLAVSAAQDANVDVFNYIVENEVQNLDEECLEVLPRTLAFACAFKEDGACCIQAAIDRNLCNKDDIAVEFNKKIRDWQTWSIPEQNSRLQKNLAQLVEKGYICGSEFCYSIDA